MKIQTMSIVVGTSACNAHCPFCVSKQTPECNTPTITNWRNFLIALNLAEKASATTILLTGKGEPTLYPDLISDYLLWISRSKTNIPFIELQTNGIRIGKGEIDRYLKCWYGNGLTTIALSAVETGFANKSIYNDDYPELKDTVAKLVGYGFTVRLSMMMMKRYICKPSDIDRVVDFCKDNKVKQLTLRPIARVVDENNVTQWVAEHALSDSEVANIVDHVNKNGNPVLHLAHGATVYDYKGQNLCLSNCLTTNDTDDNMRQIIFFPDGTIGYDWKYKGAVLL